MFKENYIIKGKILCKTGLHIGGSSDNIDIGGNDNPIIRDTTSNLPYIPGSSLKGKLRSLLELHDADSMLNILDNGGKVSTDENCIAPQIFGIGANDANELKYPTRIIVRDSFPTEESIQLWEENEDIVRGSEIKYENTINRLTSAANPRNMERVPKDSSFNFEIIFSVYDEDSVNINNVLKSMNLLEDSYLGGGGSRGFGKIEFTNIKLINRDLKYYTEDEAEKVIIEDANLEDVIQAMKN